MLPEVRNHKQHCGNCRYFRVHTTGALISCCLLLGRDLGITKPDEASVLTSWARSTTCDGWKQRPQAWNIYSHGTKRSPFWKDSYIPRETQTRLRKRLEKR